MPTADDLNVDLGGTDTAHHVGQVHSYTVGDLLEKQARNNPEKTAIVA